MRALRSMTNSSAFRRSLPQNCNLIFTLLSSRAYEAAGGSEALWRRVDLADGLARYAQQSAAAGRILAQRCLWRRGVGGHWLFSQEPGIFGRRAISFPA